MEKQKKNYDFAASYTTITKYVEQLYNGFIPSVVGKARTTQFVNVQTDIKYQKQVPLVNTTFDFVAADTCTTIANGATTSISAVIVTPCYVKVEELICLSELEQYYFGQYMKRGSNQDAIPFEEAFIDEKMGKIAKGLDKMFWQGTGAPAGCSIGLINSATASGATTVTATMSVSTAVTNGVIATFDAMIDALNTDMLSEDLILFVGQDTFDKYTRSIRNLNLYHFSPDEINGASVQLFGKRNVQLVATTGLDGSNKAILTKADFIIWGTDIAPDEEPIKGEYSMYLDKYMLRYKVKIGAALAFPTYAVVAR